MEIINYAEGGLENTGLLEEMTRAWEADWGRDFGPLFGLIHRRRMGLRPAGVQSRNSLS